MAVIQMPKKQARWRCRQTPLSPQIERTDEQFDVRSGKIKHEVYVRACHDINVGTIKIMESIKKL